MSFLHKFFDRLTPHEPLITVDIARDTLLHNIAVFKQRAPNWACAPVLKSNAYGHGLVEVARVLEGQAGIVLLIVDSYFEVRVLRTAGIKTPILVIGHTPTETIERAPFDDLSFTIATFAQLKELAASKKRLPPFHIKIDTGMHRQGILLSELDEVMTLLTQSMLHIDGLCSHLADSDGDTPDFTKLQIQRWNDAAKRWKERLPQTTWYHLAATSGTRYAKDIDANLFRLGLGLYGFESSGAVRDLQPALSMHTKITALRRVPAGESVGYTCTFTTTRETTIATIPCGYFEGIDRRLSNNGMVRIKGKECPIIGRVSMNMTTIDVTDVPGVREGDMVEVISADLTQPNTVTAIADRCSTIPYEILVHIPAHLKRMVV